MNVVKSNNDWFTSLKQLKPWREGKRKLEFSLLFQSNWICKNKITWIFIPNKRKKWFFIKQNQSGKGLRVWTSFNIFHIKSFWIIEQHNCWKYMINCEKKFKQESRRERVVKEIDQIQGSFYNKTKKTNKYQVSY